MIDFTEIPHTDDSWELFARDFLLERGFYIESPPDRGPDGGKDLLVTEEIKGSVNKYRFRWLVSCKHFAKSGKSVSEKHEPNIIERLKAFRADGFIGFYSTIPSSGLNSRLQALRKEGHIRDYYIFDHKIIESHLVTVGYSNLMLRYFKESYKTIKPLHLVLAEYAPIQCESCGKDILLEMHKQEYTANLVWVKRRDKETGESRIVDVYSACKGTCDQSLEAAANKKGLTTSWHDITDLAIPPEYLRSIIAMINRIRSGDDIYEDDAFEKIKTFYIRMAQKVLRFTTEKEYDRFVDLFNLPPV